MSMELYSILTRFLLAVIVLTWSSLATAVPNGLPQADAGKLVIAHYIIGNTYPYTLADWKNAIALASSKGIDAFALDLGRDGWETAKIADAYKAAIGTNFMLYIMFDMASLPCDKPEDGDLLRKLITAYYKHSNQLRYNGKPVVGTFGGQVCRFGLQRMDDGWNSILKTNLDPVHFIPAFFMEPPIYEGLKSIDGAFSWDSAWPTGNFDINSEYDDEHLRYLKGKTYMAGVSPWFFTHYGTDTYNKNMVYRSDNWLLAERWEILIKNRQNIDLVQLISWNDYGESHYVGPINGAQPKSESWTTGFDHQGWLDLIHYYAHAYKTGQYPQIDKDRVFLWGRLYPAHADAPDPVGKPVNYEWMQDYVWGAVFLTSDSHVDLTCGPSQLSVDLNAGVSKIRLGLQEECSVRAVVSRQGITTLDFSPPGYDFKKNPPKYNFNAFVASSSA